MLKLNQIRSFLQYERARVLVGVNAINRLLFVDNENTKLVPIKIEKDERLVRKRYPPTR